MHQCKARRPQLSLCNHIVNLPSSYCSRVATASIHIHVQNFKILKLVSGGSPGRVHPSSSHKESGHPGLLIGRVPG